ncbi:hypothetical protein T261_8106 [Streptomyces lydicus]|nr:hypothetical protein T261_8106 [Streptomyces lydicus]
MPERTGQDGPCTGVRPLPGIAVLPLTGGRPPRWRGGPGRGGCAREHVRDRDSFGRMHGICTAYAGDVAMRVVGTMWVDTLQGGLHTGGRVPGNWCPEPALPRHQGIQGIWCPATTGSQLQVVTLRLLSPHSSRLARLPWHSSSVASGLGVSIVCRSRSVMIIPFVTGTG